jgi:putative ABC transport system substrate-binding protein
MPHPLGRRELLFGVGAAIAGSTPAYAQQAAGKTPRVGILTPASSDKTPIFDSFRRGLRQLGYEDGRNITLEFRLSGGDLALLARNAAELARENVDVIVADSSTATVAASKATQRIPIVQAAGADPVALKLAATHARPGGNVTGFTLMTGELNGKRVALLRPLLPDGAAIALLANPSITEGGAFRRETEEAARGMGLHVATTVEAATPEALHALTPSAFAGAGGLVILPDAMFWNHRRDIVALAAAARLPAVCPEREYADDGGLIAYGPNVPDNFRRAAGYIDRILKGAKAAELPIQEPTKFDSVLNLKTAKSLGLEVPPVILAQADEVIE